jgi:hypothetical protein
LFLFNRPNVSPHFKNVPYVYLDGVLSDKFFASCEYCEGKKTHSLGVMPKKKKKKSGIIHHIGLRPWKEASLN